MHQNKGGVSVSGSLTYLERKKMHAIILSAGRGSRLLPLTNDLPKCLLPIGLTTVLGMQLDTLYAAGVKTATVVTGFNAHMVEAELAGRKKGPQVKTLFNPFYQVADNLASCWMARESMQKDFLLINGDTLFSPNVLEAVLKAPKSNIAVTIDKKPHYDGCLLYTSPSPRDQRGSRMPSSA